MFLWNLYFLIKLVLAASGVLQLQGLWNLGLFMALVLSNPLKTRFPNTLGALRDLLFLAPAIALLLHELGLVVSWALIDQIKLLFGFSMEYLIELLRRSISAWMVWSVVALLLITRVLNRYVRISSWVLAALVVSTMIQFTDDYKASQAAEQAEVKNGFALGRQNLSPAELLSLGQTEYAQLKVFRQEERGAALRDSKEPGLGPDAVLRGFFERQKAIVPAGLRVGTNPPDFDVIVLQICSMSWADLQSARQSQHPVLRNADFVFENFNSATSYSGPAAIRLLRGRCGQPEHARLYDAPQDNCMLFKQLREEGFSVEMGLNHDGRFENFTKLVQTNMGSTEPTVLAHNAVPVGVVGFDGSSIGRDGDYLRTWWTKRLNAKKPAVALYYNSITLHDGNRLPNSTQSSLNTYPFRLERILNDLQMVLGEIRSSERKALVLVVPEHGAGLTGEYGQLVGLRELPTPAITKVPVFGYWISPSRKPDPDRKGPVNVRQPSSYQALSELLNRWLALDPLDRDNAAWPVVLADLPSTRFVAQQGNITVLENKQSYLLKAPGVDWKILGPVQ